MESKEISAFARNLEREEINQKLKVGRNDIAPVDAKINDQKSDQENSHQQHRTRMEWANLESRG